jgi:GDPmannose 4,6-dehydratase
MKKALITGITGQDGAYLAQLLLEKQYQVFGTHRVGRSVQLWRLQELGIDQEIKFIPFDLLDTKNVLQVVEQVQPDEIYNLAAQSFVGHSFDQALYTADVDALGVGRILEAIRVVNPKIRFFQASTAEMFGQVRTSPQTESTPFVPRNPYGTAKLYGYWLTANFRDSLGIHASSAILFNHESPLRGEEFVTRKITQSLARIKYGLQNTLELGNLEAQRDWGYAKDYVVGMWKMLQHPTPDDYVLATGKTKSVKQFVELAAQVMGIEIAWEGEAQSTVGINVATNLPIVRINPQFYRPTETTLLVGNAAKAQQHLDWQTNTSFEQLVVLMAQADLEKVSRETIK